MKTTHKQIKTSQQHIKLAHKQVKPSQRHIKSKRLQPNIPNTLEQQHKKRLLRNRSSLLQKILLNLRISIHLLLHPQPMPSHDHDTKNRFYQTPPIQNLYPQPV